MTHRFKHNNNQHSVLAHSAAHEQDLNHIRSKSVTLEGWPNTMPMYGYDVFEEVYDSLDCVAYVSRAGVINDLQPY